MALAGAGFTRRLIRIPRATFLAAKMVLEHKMGYNVTAVMDRNLNRHARLRTVIRGLTRASGSSQREIAGSSSAMTFHLKILGSRPRDRSA